MCVECAVINATSQVCVITLDPTQVVPPEAERYGFRIRPRGTILGRTLMLSDLRALLASCPPDATADAYENAAVEDNAMGKPTATTRRKTHHFLGEFYGLDPDIALFRALRDLWTVDVAAQPLLALLCATARDPILRAVTPWVFEVPPGSPVTPAMLSAEAERQFPAKFSPATLATLGKNVASTWEQAGLLEGKAKKVRARADSRPTSTAYALLLGHLCGVRGAGLFTTIWARLLDAPAHLLREQAIAASQQGWLEYRAAGDVVEVTFRHLLRDDAE